MPEITPEAYDSNPDNASQAIPREAWWLNWENPELTNYIQQGLSDSFTIKAISERLVQAKASFIQNRALLFPDLSVSLNGSLESDQKGETDYRFSPGLRSSWEIDTAGSLRYRTLEKQVNFLAEVDALELARLELTVDIAVALLDIQTQQQLIQLVNRQAGNATDRLNVVESRFQQGVASRLDVLQQEGLLADIRSQLPSIEREFKAACLRLDVLLGRLPGTIHPSIVKMETFEIIPGRPSIGTPLQLLINRPDLRSMRLRLTATDANVGRAIAERWPRLSLELDMIWREGTSISQGLATLAANLFQPLFDSGSRKAEVNKTKAARNEQLHLFTQDFIQAISEVEDLVYSEDKTVELLDRLNTRRLLLIESETQATNRYEQGFTDFLPVITARQDLLSIEQRMVREQRNLVALRFNLHRALGGPMPVDLAYSQEEATPASKGLK